MILLRTASDLSHLSMVGSNIVKKMVSTHMKLLLTSLHADEHRYFLEESCTFKKYILHCMPRSDIVDCFISTALFASVCCSCPLWFLKEQRLPGTSSVTQTSAKEFLDLLAEETKRCALVKLLNSWGKKSFYNVDYDRQ